ALGIEYDGSHYHGWQKQKKLHTVQQQLEYALGRVAAHPINVQCAGRTDTGVHATCQVVHFDTSVQRNEYAWVMGTNSHLSKDICVRWAQPVADDFDARRSARSRRYIYLIANQFARPALYRSNMTWQYRTLDHEKMHEAGQYLIGEHDFTSFRAVECQARSPQRCVNELTVQRRGNLIAIEISANAFLHHMVRNIAGVLMSVGCHRHSPEWVDEVLQARDRRLGAATAPAYGLYLIQVLYPLAAKLHLEAQYPWLWCQ
ncbi:MAG: tRNA pseudouridine(38-40) synthase TruA, partial [Legionellales bacterium]|nr:tRNA pseudouridine(38-40) synthase TruA [Legionellales bacterium]